MEQCERAKYVEAGKFVTGVGGSYVGGVAGQRVMVAICEKAKIRHGVALLGCAIIGGAAGGWFGGNVGAGIGEKAGDLIYKGTADE